MWESLHKAVHSVKGSLACRGRRRCPMTLSDDVRARVHQHLADARATQAQQRSVPYVRIQGEVACHLCDQPKANIYTHQQGIPTAVHAACFEKMLGRQ